MRRFRFQRENDDRVSDDAEEEAMEREDQSRIQARREYCRSRSSNSSRSNKPCPRKGPVSTTSGSRSQSAAKLRQEPPFSTVHWLAPNGACSSRGTRILQKLQKGTRPVSKKINLTINERKRLIIRIQTKTGHHSSRSPTQN